MEKEKGHSKKSKTKVPEIEKNVHKGNIYRPNSGFTSLHLSFADNVTDTFLDGEVVTPFGSSSINSCSSSTPWDLNSPLSSTLSSSSRRPSPLSAVESGMYAEGILVPWESKEDGLGSRKW